MFKKVIGIVAVLILLFLIFVSMQPAGFTISRSVSVNASPATVFGLVNDFHRFNEWNPFIKAAPPSKQSYEGAPAGVGAVYRWAGDAHSGEGSMTITESRPNELVKIKLEFLKPMAATNLAEFSFKPVGKQTVVTWSMSGQKNFISKAITLFVNMDKMVGGEFENGLAKLKALAESQTKK